jgi:hypothetical protein
VTGFIDLGPEGKWWELLAVVELQKKSSKTKKSITGAILKSSNKSRKIDTIFLLS